MLNSTPLSAMAHIPGNTVFGANTRCVYSEVSVHLVANIVHCIVE